MNSELKPDPASAFVPLHATVDSSTYPGCDEQKTYLRPTEPDPAREEAFLRTLFYRDARAVFDDLHELLYLVEAFERRNNDRTPGHWMEHAGYGPQLTYDEAVTSATILSTVAFLRHALFTASARLSDVIRLDLQVTEEGEATFGQGDDGDDEPPVIAEPK
jgi:hypothetical protein